MMIRRSRLRAEGFTAEALRFQRLAEQARADYTRMRQEYADRHPLMPGWIQDMRYAGFAVVKECISDDQWYSRQAQENQGAANMEYARQVRLLEEMRGFLQARTRARVPSPRNAG